MSCMCSGPQLVRYSTEERSGKILFKTGGPFKKNGNTLEHRKMSWQSSDSYGEILLVISTVRAFNRGDTG